jgi:hypothetical protein
MNASMPAAVSVALYRQGRVRRYERSMPAAVRVALCRMSPEI